MASDYQQIEVGGSVIEIPVDAPPEAIKKAVNDFLSSPEFDRTIDKTSGAPARVREVVGGSPTQDRLANLKRFYPDAISYGDGNFVFTEPRTGRATLYNPTGLDIGDVASMAREGAQAIGAGFGAVLGAPAGLLGTAAGAGAGTVVAGSLYDIAKNTLDNRLDTRSWAQSVLETGTEFMAGAAGQRLGEALPEVFKTAIRSATPAAQRLMESYSRLAIKPPAGAATGSRAVGSVEKMLEATPTSSSLMQQQAERVVSQTKSAAEKLAARFASVKTPMGAGETVRAAAVRAAERFNFVQEKAYQEAFDLVGPETLVDVSSVASLRAVMEGELARAPQSLARTLGSAIATLKSIEADAAEGLQFQALRQIRTEIGRDLAKPMLSGSTGAQNEAFKRIYAALTQDMSAAAKAAGPQAAKKLAAADRYTRLYMNTSAKTMQKIADFDADERAWNFVIAGTKDGAQQLARMKRHFTDEEFDTIAATVLGRLGLARPGAQNAAGDAFSVNTFLTNWSRMTPEAKNLLFGGKRYADLRQGLDDLVSVVGSLKDMERLANTSNTGRVMVSFMVLQTLAGGLGGLIGGDIATAGGAMATTVVAPWVAARLLTSPSFVRWLTTPVTSPSAISAHLTRLAAIAEAEPQLKEEIGQYLAAFRETPAGAQPSHNKPAAQNAAP